MRVFTPDLHQTPFSQPHSPKHPSRCHAGQQPRLVPERAACRARERALGRQAVRGLLAVDEHTLAQLISRTSRCAFEHVRSSLHRLDMARELIASGCPELQLTAPALAFSLTVRHGPFDDT